MNHFQTKKATGKSTCRICKQIIPKGELVVMPWMVIQFHAKCLMKEIVRINILSGEKINLNQLKKEAIVDELITE